MIVTSIKPIGGLALNVDCGIQSLIFIYFSEVKLIDDGLNFGSCQSK